MDTEIPGGIMDQEILRWLCEVRAFHEQTIRKRAGLESKKLLERREEWGLEQHIMNSEWEKTMAAKGLVDSYRVDDRPIRLRIRRPEPEDGPRYYLIPGSIRAAWFWKAILIR